MTVADDARALVARSRAAQGLPERITDPAILARVAAILAGVAGREAAPGHHSGADLITTTTTADPTCWKGDARGPS